MVLLLLLLLVSFAGGFNLVVDVNPKAINRYLESFKSFYVQQLNDHEIPLIEKDRCLGKIAIASTTVSQVEVEACQAVKENGDYYLKVTHLHARLHGEYNHNVLFVHQKGDFDLRIRDLNATLGPLVPVAISGFPYIDNNVGCRISHAEDNFDVHGGILKVVARRRLKQTLETDLENLLCDSFVNIMDRGIRISLEALQMKTPINDAEVLSFALERPPVMLESGAVRTFHEGAVTSLPKKNFRFDIENDIDLNFDAIFHIHQNLLTEALRTACQKLNKVVLNTTVQCNSIAANFSGINEQQNILLNMDLYEDEMPATRSYNSRLLHSTKLVLFIRVKSENLVPGTKGSEFGRQLFALLSDNLRSNFQIVLPIPKNLQLDNVQASFQSDKLLLKVLANFDCYKFGPTEFTTIVECPAGCEYSFTDSSHEQSMWGGCGSGNDGCQKQGDLTICSCRTSLCNVDGYQKHISKAGRISHSSTSKEED